MRVSSGHELVENRPESIIAFRSAAALEPPGLRPRATRLGFRAVLLDSAERIVELVDGERLPYDKLLISTGARNRRPGIPGLDLEGVFDLRIVDDADCIRTEALPGGRRSWSAWDSSARRSRPRSVSSASR